MKGSESILRSRIAAITVCVVALAFGCGDAQLQSAGGHGKGQDAALTKASIVAALRQSSTGKAAALAKLETVVPIWNATELMRIPASSAMGPDFAVPRQVAAKFTSETLTFIEQGANGREIFKNESASVTLKVSSKEGIWKLFQPYQPMVSGDAPYSSSEASGEAHRLFSELNLPTDQMGFEVNTTLAYKDGESRETVPHARHVRIHRLINGLRTRNSRFMVTFDLKGNPYRIESEWPPFALDSTASLHERSQALDLLSDVLASRFERPEEIADVTAELSYHRMEGGLFEPVISISLFSASGIGSPDLIEFSLVRGLLDVNVSKSVDS